MITSPSNERVKATVRLMRERRERTSTGRFVIEGFRELTRAVDAGLDLESVFICPELYLKGNESTLVERAGVTPTEVTKQVFAKLSYRDRPEGLLAVARAFDVSLGALPDAPSLVLVVEGIEKPGNLGAMLRTACAAGVEAVIVCDEVTDVFNPNVIRSSVGMVFSVPIAVAATDAAVVWLRARSIPLIATTPAAEASLWQADMRAACALAVGSEQYGASDALLAAADQRIVIPMPGTADSLNAAQAAAVVLFEAVRQRAG